VKVFLPSVLRRADVYCRPSRASLRASMIRLPLPSSDAFVLPDV